MFPLLATPSSGRLRVLRHSAGFVAWLLRGAPQTAPSVAEIAICETLSSFDSTNGASELVVKAKADDTVKTGSIALV